MAGGLAQAIATRYLGSDDTVLDPFCGSGAVLAAARPHVRSVTGVDINPYATLLASVKLNGFDSSRAKGLLNDVWALQPRNRATRLPIRWNRKAYWFTPATLRKLEELRYACMELSLRNSPEGRAILLSLALSVRPCSKADQRSPKPFISRRARQCRGGRHFDPFKVMAEKLDELSFYYPSLCTAPVEIHCGDVRDPGASWALPQAYSAVVTSPPYINAQDYFRNSKLELYVLENLLPFETELIKPLFIGTERGVPTSVTQGPSAMRRRELIPGLTEIESRSRTHGAIVHAYFDGMEKALDVMRTVVSPGGTLIVVCGDNLICGVHLRTWEVLLRLLSAKNLQLLAVYGDPIRSRLLAPSRAGHRGLIKEEKVLAFAA